MIKEERYALILAKLDQEKKITVASLSHELQFSEATVRRDLTKLDALGKVRKVHGGAISPTSALLTFRQRQEMQPDSKHRIARKALPLLLGAQCIIIDASTTNLALVRQFPPDLVATCITNSPAIAQQLARHQGVLVLLTGGSYQIEDDALVGSFAIQSMRNVYADVCLLGVCSVHAEHGLTTSCLEQAAVKQTMMQQARRTIALADVAKIDRVERYRVGDIRQLCTIVTDISPKEERWQAYRRQQVEIV